jgi:Trypsin-like peptidase domain
MTMRIIRTRFTRRIRGGKVVFGLILLLILYLPETGSSISKPDYISSAKDRFVLVTSECKLGSGFLTGYREGGKAEVVTAYHLIRCKSGKAKRKSKVVQVDGVMAEIHGADPQQDLLRLLVPLHKNTAQIAIRTISSTGEPVFAVGSNPQGERSVITWGSVLITPPGEVTAKLPILPGTSGGQLISAVDGTLLGMPVRAKFGFADSVGGNVLLRFLEKTRCR